MASRMIEPKTIKALLTTNVDENAAHFALFTIHGTLVGADDGVHIPTQRSLAALIGLTWRRHVAEIEGRGSPSADIQHVKTLRLMHHKGNAKQLKGMIVQWEGTVAAVEAVKEGVLLAAQLPLGDFCDEEDVLGKRLARLALDVEAASSEGRENGSARMGHRRDDVPKARILELRAQGMAEAIAEEWPGPLPEGYY